MIVSRIGKSTLAACALALPTVMLSGSASASTQRWAEPSFTPTMNDGLELSGLTLKGQSVLHNASLPYFMFNGERYELTESRRAAGPFVGDADGFTQISSTYTIPVKGGTVTATIYYTMLDYASSDSDEAQLSSWVKFDGPKGDYRFFWRLDTDLGSRANNRLDHGVGSDLTALTREARIDLDSESVRVVDPRSYLEQEQLYFQPNKDDRAVLYAVNFHPGEVEALPETLVNNEALTGAPKGSDMVLWYTTELRDTSHGLTGPDMYVVAATRVNATLEVDKMSSAEFIDQSATVYNETRSLKSAFATGSINVNDYRNDKQNYPDDSSTTNAELNSWMVANKTYESVDSSTNWYSWAGVALMSSSGSSVLGIMFDDGNTNTDGKPRQGCGIFYNAHHDASWPSGDTYQAELILSVTHEQGHVYNQHHEDYCYAKNASSTFHSNSAIMGYAFQDTSHWTFSPGSITSMSSDDETYVRPGHGVSFTTNGSYNMTSAHSAKHASTSCRRRCCKKQ